MKRTSNKKGTDRRKRARNRPTTSSAGHSSALRGEHSGDSGRSASSFGQGQTQGQTQRQTKSARVIGRAQVEAKVCQSCQQELSTDSRVLFVEEEQKRTFCSESCISQYFAPQIERLEQDYLEHVTPADFSESEREALAHLRWITLQEPDEIWCEPVMPGDLFYTLISEFNAGNKKVWCVCVCLYLRGEPSFLFVAFPTRDPLLVEFFRKGEKLDGVAQGSSTSQSVQPSVTDGLANSWTEDESLRAQLGQERREDDIAPELFEQYHGCLDSTLQTPDEVWSIILFEEGDRKLYHFIKYFPGDEEGVWYLVIARETEDRDQIEILEAFPTRDSSLVQRYRAGRQEVGQAQELEHRVIH